MSLVEVIHIKREKKRKEKKRKEKKTKHNTTQQKNNTMANAMKAQKMDLGKVSFSAPKTLDNGGKMIYVNYNGGINPLHIQTPEGELIWDPNYFADDGKEVDSSLTGKYSVTMSIKKAEKGMLEFHDSFVALDEYIMTAAKENSQAWFKKPKISEDAIRELYTPQIKVSVDSETGLPNEYPPKFTYKVVKRDGKFKDFVIYDNNKKVFDVNKTTDEPVELSNVMVKGARVKVVLKCNGIWVANGKFGCTWRAEQILIKVPEGGLRDFAILSDSDEEVEAEEVVVEEKPNMLEDTDEEEVEEEVVEEKAEPKKKTRKVRVKKDSE